VRLSFFKEGGDAFEPIAVVQAFDKTLFFSL
jgi:hypothetical protein